MMKRILFQKKNHDCTTIISHKNTPSRINRNQFRLTSCTSSPSSNHDSLCVIHKDIFSHPKSQCRFNTQYTRIICESFENHASKNLFIRIPKQFYSSTSKELVQDQRPDSYRCSVEDSKERSIHEENMENNCTYLKGEGDKGGIHIVTTTTASTTVSQGRAQHSISIEKISSISNRIQKAPIGNLKEVDVREACQAINTMAHFVVHSSPSSTLSSNDKQLNQKAKGELAWLILKRVLIENGSLYDEDSNNLTLQILHSDHSKSNKNISIDAMVFHDAIKCMTRSGEKSLINLADDIVHQLEQHYLKTKSKTIHPLGRSYALLLDSMKDADLDGHEIVHRVQDILNRVKIQENAGNKNVSINPHINNSALNTLTLHSQNNAIAYKAVQDIISESTSQLDHVSYSIAIKSILSSNKWFDVVDKTTGVTTAQAIENIFVQMKNRGLGNPNRKTMTPILHSLSKEGNSDEILHVLEWMEDMYQNWGWDNIRPNHYHFNTMISALARNLNDEKSIRSGYIAVQILDKMKELYNNGNAEVRPDLVTYNAVLHVISKESGFQHTKKNQCGSDIGERAEGLLRRMEDGEEGEHISPDIFSYNAVLSAYMNCLAPDAASKAQTILQRMNEKDVQPDLLSYTICINTLAKSKAQGSAQNAEDLLRVLENAYADGCEELKPDVKCYNSVIYAWANSKEYNGIKRANQILSEMDALRKSGKRPDLIPDAVSYTNIISALAHDSNSKNIQHTQSIIDNMFSMMNNENDQEIQLDSAVYNALIYAQSKQSGSAEKALMLLNYMLDGDSKSKVRPNTITFNSVIDALSKSKERGSSARAEEVLNKMQQLHELGHKDIRPDTFSFASVLNAFANSDAADAAKKAEDILQHMHQLHMNGNDSVRPNTVCFATVIKAYSRSRQMGSAQRAEEILKWMFEVYKAGNQEVKPNTIAFTSACEAWSRSGSDDAVERVEGLINWMKELSNRGYKDIKPNEYTYNSLLTAIARSKHPDKADRALKIVDFMQSDPNLTENIFNYNNVLLACAYTHGTPADRFNALKVAIVALEKAMKRARRNERMNITYGVFFQACANLTQTEDEKIKIEKIVENVFHKCCDHGQIDEQLLKQVRKASTQQLYLRLFGSFKNFPRVTLRDIPSEWQKNVRQRKR